MNQIRTMVLDTREEFRARVRTGTVIAATPNSLTVDVAGTSVPASFLRGADIVIGDLVALLEQGGSWLALGAIAGVGPNEVINPSFEDDMMGWTVYQVTGVVAANSTGPSLLAVDGEYFLSVSTSDVSAQGLVYSDPIPVTAGDTYSLSAYVWGTYQVTATPDADAELMALWFAAPTDLYPTTSSADTVVATLTNVPERPPLSTLSGQVVAPVTGYLRVGLRSTLSTAGSLGYDLVIAREVTP